MLSILPYVANAIVLIVYFFLDRPHPIADFSAIPIWPILAFVVFLVTHVAAFSVQDTTRQLVRIFLLRRSGVGYDDGLLPVYQLKMTPNWTVPMAPLYMGAHVASFVLLLFSLGWGVAIGAHVAAHFILSWIPIPYALFLPSIRNHLQRQSEMKKLMAFTEGFDTDGFLALIDEAIKTRRNLGDWWAKLLWEKTAQQVEANRKEFSEQFEIPEMKTEERMRRPGVVTAIAWFLIIWNAFVMIAGLPQDLFYREMPIAVALLTRLLSFRMLFLIVGINLLGGRNWARITYIIAAPLNLTINLVLGTMRLGAVNILDRIPALVITVLFVVLLLRPKATSWFRGTPLPSAPSALQTKRRPAWFIPVSVAGVLIMTLTVLFWLANHFLRVAGPGDERSQGIIEYYLSK
ncbi:MAG: hypothetical protein K9N51_12730 [Candidatus Pacebacteria bacterium]|nr:hypothetical protein [Candidatus Paceibacterota bacterium]